MSHPEHYWRTNPKPKTLPPNLVSSQSWRICQEDAQNTEPAVQVLKEALGQAHFLSDCTGCAYVARIQLRRIPKQRPKGALFRIGALKQGAG